ncbi:MAG: transcriptional repressor LexA [bacterium]|nr:transcriptional repressor LexA [bacterium]
MKTTLTSKQVALLDFIQEQVRAQGYPPTLREIAARFKFRAVGTVQGYVRALIAKGFLAHEPEHARALCVRQYPGSRFHIPILGQVAAGQPVFAPENYSGSLPCGELVAHPAATFALHVRGDSMIEAGILEGDFVLVQKQATARNADIVVARINNEVTVKRFFMDSAKCIRLVPENKSMAAIIVEPPLDVEVLGKVVGVYRKLR